MRRTTIDLADAGAPSIPGGTRHAATVQSGDDQEAWIDLARIAAGFAVVMLHTAAYYMYLFDMTDTVRWMVANLIDSSVRWCVPMFVMISGHLLLDRNKQQDPGTFYRKLWTRLLAPTLLWSVFYLVFANARLIVHSGQVHAASILLPLLMGKPYYHLWYMYMIIGIYTFAPFVKHATDGMDERSLAALFGLCTLYGMVANGITVYTAQEPSAIVVFPEFLGYFIGGHLFGRVVVVRRPGAAALLALAMAGLTAVATFLLVSAYGMERGLYAFEYLSPNVVVLSLSMFVLLRSGPVASRWQPALRRVSGLVFGIYLIHAAVLETARYLLGPALASPATIMLTAVGVFGVSAAATALLQRIPVIRHVV